MFFHSRTGLFIYFTTRHCRLSLSKFVSHLAWMEKPKSRARGSSKFSLDPSDEEPMTNHRVPYFFQFYRIICLHEGASYFFCLWSFWISSVENFSFSISIAKRERSRPSFLPRRPIDHVILEFDRNNSASVQHFAPKKKTKKKREVYLIHLKHWVFVGDTKDSNSIDLATIPPRIFRSSRCTDVLVLRFYFTEFQKPLQIPNTGEITPSRR